MVTFLDWLILVSIIIGYVFIYQWGVILGQKKAERIRQLEKDANAVDRKIGTYYISGKRLQEFVDKLKEVEDKYNMNLTVDVFDVVYLDGSTLGFVIRKPEEE